MTNWKEIIEENEEKIMEACFEADKEAYANTHLRVLLYLCEDGTTYTFSDVAGGNDRSREELDGEVFFLAEFCYQCYSVLDNVDINAIIDYLPEDRDYMAEYKKYLEDEELEDEKGGFVRWLRENYEDELNTADMELFCEDLNPEDYSPYVEKALEKAEQTEEWD